MYNFFITGRPIRFLYVYLGEVSILIKRNMEESTLFKIDVFSFKIKEITLNNILLKLNNAILLCIFYKVIMQSFSKSEVHTLQIHQANANSEENFSQSFSQSHMEYTNRLNYSF